jgi:hypothetical protein
MITDAQTRLSSAQAVTTGTQLSTNSYDLGSARDIGRGQDVRVKVTVNTAFTGGTSLQVNVVEDSSSTLGSATVVVTGAVIAEAALTAGASLIDAAIPRTTKRYLGIQFVSVGTHTTGAVDANMVLDTDSGIYFPANTGF